MRGAPRAAIVSPSESHATRGRKSAAQELSSARFRRIDRLTLPWQFEDSLARRAILRSELFALHIVRNPAGWRLGLVVPKRYVPSAVRRNLIKRTWREAFRRARAGVEAGAGYDLVVRVRSKPKTTTSTQFRVDCHRDVDRLLAELVQKHRLLTD